MTAPIPNSRRQAEARLLAPVRGLMRRASAVAVLAGLLWPVQAAAVASAIAGWTQGAALQQSLWAALVFALAGALRAGLDHLAGGHSFVLRKGFSALSTKSI